jgi:hypothetical protein
LHIFAPTEEIRDNLKRLWYTSIIVNGIIVKQIAPNILSRSELRGSAEVLALPALKTRSLFKGKQTNV